MHKYLTYNENKIHSIHSHVHLNSFKQIQVHKFQHKNTYLGSEARPATSYVTATFHPTIGVCAYQSLSSTATPELGMSPIRNKEY